LGDSGQVGGVKGARSPIRTPADPNYCAAIAPRVLGDSGQVGGVKGARSPIRTPADANDRGGIIPRTDTSWESYGLFMGFKQFCGRYV